MGALTIVGPGRMGLSLAAAFARSGAWDEIVLCGRHPEAPDHPILSDPAVRYVFGLEAPTARTEAILIAVGDDDLPEVAFALGGLGRAPAGCAAFHLSGALPTDVLAPLHHQGYGVGAFHPLIAVGDPIRGADRLAGAHVAVTAEPEALRAAHRLADSIGAEAFAVPAVRRPLVHAATTLLAGTIVALVDHAGALLEHAGVDPDDALPALVALGRGTLTAAEEGGVPEALRGPIGLGDVETVALHLRALDGEDRRRYAVFGRELLRLAAGEASDPVLSLPGSHATPDPEARRALEVLFERTLEDELAGAGG